MSGTEGIEQDTGGVPAAEGGEGDWCLRAAAELSAWWGVHPVVFCFGVELG